MTPSELRAAAERVIQTYVTDPEMLGVHIHPTMTELASVDCARHIVATVRADDGEPITQEWCELHPTDWREHMSQYIHRRNPALIIANGCLCVGGKRTPITTLGPMRRLLSELGIEVTMLTDEDLTAIRGRWVANNQYHQDVPLLLAELAALREELSQTPPTLEWLRKTLGLQTTITVSSTGWDNYYWSSGITYHTGHQRATGPTGLTLKTRAAVLAAVEGKQA